MTFAELQQAIYSLTNRPDLEDMTVTAIQAATLKCHQTDFYTKDIYETPVQFDSADYRKSLDYISIIPNYRALKYMREYDVASQEAGKFFNVITTEEILDKWNREVTDVCYVAGRVLEIKSSTAFDTVLFAAYVNPVIIPTNYKSWVAEQYPFAIVHEACRFVFSAIGMAEEASTQARLFGEQLQLLTINAITDEGS